GQRQASDYVRALGTVYDAREGVHRLFVSDRFRGMAVSPLDDLKQQRTSHLCAPWVVSRDGRFALDGSMGLPIPLAHLQRNGEPPVLSKDTFKNPFVGLAFSPDGKQFAHADNDGDVVLRDLPGAREIGRLVGHKKSHAYALAYSPDGCWLASGASALEGLWLWDLCSKEPRRKWKLGSFVDFVTFLDGSDSLLALQRAGPQAGVVVLSREGQGTRRIGDPINANRLVTAVAG